LSTTTPETAENEIEWRCTASLCFEYGFFNLSHSEKNFQKFQLLGESFLNINTALSKHAIFKKNTDIATGSAMRKTRNAIALLCHKVTPSLLKT